MNKKELAARLTGRECPFEPTTEEAAGAFRDDLVIVFGDNDDLMEFRGVIHDEIRVENGDSAFIIKDELGEGYDVLSLACGCGEVDCVSCFTKKAITAWAIPMPPSIEAVYYGSSDVPSWNYKTTIPHETFEVFEDGDLYCRGIVFSVDDLGEGLKSGLIDIDKAVVKAKRILEGSFVNNDLNKLLEEFGGSDVK